MFPFLLVDLNGNTLLATQNENLLGGAPVSSAKYYKTGSYYETGHKKKQNSCRGEMIPNNLTIIWNSKQFVLRQVLQLRNDATVYGGQSPLIAVKSHTHTFHHFKSLTIG
jgi:hypothetical protein